jgi:hypothetical protein
VLNDILTCSTEGRRCYATLLSLIRNRGRTVPWIRSPLGIVALHGCLATVVEWFHGYAHHRCTVACMVTNSVSCIATNSMKASVSIGTARCCKGKAIHNSQSVSLWIQSESVYPIAWGSRPQFVAGVRNAQPSKWDVGAVQFRQWDPRSYECYSVHYNCNVCSCKSPERINPVTNSNPRRVISHTTTQPLYTWQYVLKECLIWYINEAVEINIAAVVANSSVLLAEKILFFITKSPSVNTNCIRCNYCNRNTVLQSI